MPAYALTSPAVFVGPYDLSNMIYMIDGQVITNDLDATTFGSGGWHVRVAGLHDVALNVEGFRDEAAGPNQGGIYALLGTNNNVVTIGMETGAAATAALMLKAIDVGLDHPGQVGALATFKVPFKASSVAVEGKIIWPSSTITSSSSSGTYQNLGAVTAAQYLYGTQHITSFVGSSTASIVTTIKSATNASGLGATTRLTFTSQTTASGEFAARVAGPVTDTFWGASWTITGNTVSIVNVAAMGIQ
jgi:hypothetical protein